MANKKINQLVSKTAILSTDIFGIGDATTGQLFKKTIAELQAAIGGAVISVNGLVGTVVLDTDDIQELATPTNKYFTDARARGAISLTVTGNSGASTYSSGTGVLNVPTYTLAGLGGISATFLSGTSGISYNSTTGVISYSGTVYTDASIRALLSGSTGISYNSTTGAISYSGTVYTDSSVRALISITTTGTSGASTYNNTTGVINVPNYTLAGLGGISLTSLSGGTGITYNNTTGAISYSGTVYTDASVRALVSAGTGLTYNSSTGVFTSSITQYTDALARASISITTTGTSGASTYNSTTGVLNVPQYQGVITLTTTGTSGAATFSSNTLNIPQYQSVLTNPVTGTGTTGYHAKWTSSSAIGNSVIYDNGTSVGIGTATPNIIGFTGPILTIAGTAQGHGIEIWRNSNTIPDNEDLGVITFLGGTTPTQLARIIGKSVGTNEDGGSLSFQTCPVGGGVTERIRLTSIGNLGLGTSAPQLLVASGLGIEISSAAGGSLVLSKSANPTVDYGGISYDGNARIHSNGFIGFSLSGSRHITIHNNGNMALNTTADNGYKLYVSGTIYATGNITANSDLTLKKNLELITNPTDKLMQLNGYSYQWKSDDSHQYGVIAQEVEKILPYAVSTGNDGIKGVSYNQIIPVLIEAVKEQKAKIENLEILLASK
jgi:hypothetical protein